MTWTQTRKRSGNVSRPRRPPALRWCQQQTGKGRPTHPIGRMSIALVDLFFELAAALDIPEPIGVAVFIGRDADEGSFALKPATYSGPLDRDVYAVDRRTGRRTFSCADLCDVQARGWSRMSMVDGMLVGHFGTDDPPHMPGRRPKRFNKPATRRKVHAQD